MCTVTFIPGADGFVLGMNRDEKRQRVRIHPPRLDAAGAMNRHQIRDCLR
jgi:hypothetical protein